MTPPAQLLDRLRARTPEMVESLRTLVEAESPSSDPVATAACASVAAELVSSLLGSAPERVESEGLTHLRWGRVARGKVVLLGHLDTVWPLGTLRDIPFKVDGDVASGPGTFDMKAGVVQMLYALAEVEDLGEIAVLLTTDEEVGSMTSRGLIKETVAGARAALVLEPSAEGALKVARKGVSTHRVRAIGRSAHAGLEPEKGLNATVELAHQILAVEKLARPEVGTTVTPSMMTSGSSTNSVPSEGNLTVDVRVPTPEEEDRVLRGLASLSPVISGARLEVEKVAGSPPFPRSASAELYAIAREINANLGLGDLEGVTVGGGSDGNVTASHGVRTLDGLGAVGGGAHAIDEHVVVSKMPERAALVAGLVMKLLDEA